MNSRRVPLFPFWHKANKEEIESYIRSHLESWIWLARAAKIIGKSKKVPGNPRISIKKIYVRVSDDETDSYFLVYYGC
jgi:hypothetical protein